MNRSFHSLLLSAAVLCVAPPSGARQVPPEGGGGPLYVEDFDRAGGLAGHWEGIGAIRASRVPVTGATIPGVAGKMVRVEARPRSSLRTAPLAGRPALDRCERIVFRVDAASATPARPVVLEVQFLAAGRRAWWWRKVELDRPGWREVDLPLSDFRTGGGVPSWEEVDRLGFSFRTGATLELDGIELRRGRAPGAAYLSTAELGREAFGGGRPARVLRRGPFVVSTDEPGLDEARLLDALAAMYGRTRADLPGVPPPSRPVPLLIFAADRDYRAFWPRFARRFEAELAAPRSGGFTALGVASAPSAADPTTVRPVFVHEASHALMGQMLGLDNRGEWLFEGLATRYQLAFSGQDIGPIVRAGLAEVRSRTPFEDLLDGEPIPEARYWQASLVIDWLLADPGRRERFFAALGAMRRRGSTDLRPLVRGHFGVTLAELEASWLAWARGRPRPEGRRSSAGTVAPLGPRRSVASGPGISGPGALQSAVSGHQPSGGGARAALPARALRDASGRVRHVAGTGRPARAATSDQFPRRVRHQTRRCRHHR
jgi:hypothetical protein